MTPARRERARLAAAFTAAVERERRRQDRKHGALVFTGTGEAFEADVGKMHEHVTVITEELGEVARAALDWIAEARRSGGAPNGLTCRCPPCVRRRGQLKKELVEVAASARKLWEALS